MSFGDDDTPQVQPPALPPPPPSTPQFASGASKFFTQGKPMGGTIMTNPLAPSIANTARKSLVTM